MSSRRGPRVVFVTGATASGKSEWALRVAEETQSLIVNCDSVQVYQDVVIGSGLPTAEDFARADHRLYAYVQAPHEMTAGTYRRDFFDLMNSLPGESRVLVVGGTGFYFQAIEKGMFEVPPVDEEIAKTLREELEVKGPEELWKELVVADPDAAHRLSPNDSYRIVRALELCRSGRRASEVRAGFRPEPFPYPLLKTEIRREREKLRERIRQRTKKMIEAGLREETRGLLARGLERWPPLASVGYRETVQALKAGLDDQWLFDEICLRTGQLAKRQETWFKRDKESAVYTKDEDFPEFRDRVLRFFETNGRLGRI